MPALQRTTLFLILSIIAIIVVGGLWTFFMLRFRAEKAELSVFLQTRGLFEKNQSSFAERRKVLQETTEERERLKMFFVVGQSGSALFYDKIENLGNEIGIDISVVSVDDAEIDIFGKKKPVRSITVGATGSFPSLMHFMELVETLDEQIRIEKGVLRRTGELWTLNLVMTLISYQVEL